MVSLSTILIIHYIIISSYYNELLYSIWLLWQVIFLDMVCGK